MPPRPTRDAAAPDSSLPSTRPDALDAALNRAYAVVAYTMNRHLVDHMLRMGRRFGGDYAALLVWGVLSHLNVAHLIPPGSLPSSVLDDWGRLPAEAHARLRPVRLRDLAQITGIPRETVRRKLDALQAQGWIRRADRGWVLDLESVDPALRDFQIDVARRFLATADAVHAALRDAAPPAG